MTVIGKKMWRSKTLVVNLVALIAIGLQVAFETEIVSAEEQTAIVIVINLILRAVTKEPIDWKLGLLVIGCVSMLSIGCTALRDDTIVATADAQGATLLVGATPVTPTLLLSIGKIGLTAADISAGENEGVEFSEKHISDVDLSHVSENVVEGESKTSGIMTRETSIQVYQVGPNGDTKDELRTTENSGR